MIMEFIKKNNIPINSILDLCYVREKYRKMFYRHFTNVYTGVEHNDNKYNDEQIEKLRKNSGKTIKHGIIIGIFLCLATNFQQFAFYQSGMTAGKIAFITAMYMFFVPLFEFAIFKKKISKMTLLCIALGFMGLDRKSVV